MDSSPSMARIWNDRAPNAGRTRFSKQQGRASANASGIRTGPVHKVVMLSALPAARDFRGDLRAARESAGAARADRLRALSQHRLDYLETLQVDRALQALTADERASLAPVRLALVGSATIDHLLPAIRVAGL